MSDLISRQAVIDRISRLIEAEKKQGTDDWGYGRERVNAYEAMLHFVKSEYLYPSVEPEKCGDCISRQATIKALYTEIIKRRLLDDVNDGMLDEFDTESILRALPSVEPERKKGKWKHMVGFWECDQCHAEYTGMPTCMGKVIYEYCPMCGSKMEANEKA